MEPCIYLQWTTVGPAVGGVLALTRRMKPSRPVAWSGTPWSGHPVKWNWRISLISATPLWEGDGRSGIRIRNQDQEGSDCFDLQKNHTTETNPASNPETLKPAEVDVPLLKKFSLVLVPDKSQTTATLVSGSLVLKPFSLVLCPQQLDAVVQ